MFEKWTNWTFLATETGRDGSSGANLINSRISCRPATRVTCLAAIGWNKHCLVEEGRVMGKQSGQLSAIDCRPEMLRLIALLTNFLLLFYNISFGLIRRRNKQENIAYHGYICRFGEKITLNFLGFFGNFWPEGIFPRKWHWPLLCIIRNRFRCEW